MFPELTRDQLALRDELRAYFGGLMSPAERVDLLTERHGTVYREVVRRMGRDRWLGVGWPVRFGGRGFGQVEQPVRKIADPPGSPPRGSAALGFPRSSWSAASFG